jgi:hypothetical protein
MAYRKNWYSFGEPIFEKKMKRHLWHLTSLLMTLISGGMIFWSLKLFVEEQGMLAYAWALGAWVVSWNAWMIMPL